MNTLRLARACSWPMNSASRCGRNEASVSSSRRSAATRRRGLFMNTLAAIVPSPLEGEGVAQCSRLARNDKSLRQLLQALPDERRGVGALTRVAGGGSDRGGGLRLTVTEIDQRGHSVHHRPRRALLVER